MSHTNRYYIVDANDSNLNDIIDISVGNLVTQRYSLDESEIVIKLHKHDHKDYKFLNKYKKYNHNSILEVMQTDKWTQNIEQDA